MPDDFEVADDTTNENPNLRNLREQAKRAKDLEADNAAKDQRIAELERKDAFRTAGIDPADPKAKYFVKAYDGDLTADAIRAEAEAAGLVGEPAVPPPPAASPDELAAFGRFADAATGGQGGQAPDTWESELLGLGNPSPRQIAEVMERHGRPVVGLGPLDPVEGSGLR